MNIELVYIKSEKDLAIRHSDGYFYLYNYCPENSRAYTLHDLKLIYGAEDIVYLEASDLIKCLHFSLNNFDIL